jgi:tetratricopeptide (TPR) repeat protein
MRILQANQLTSEGLGRNSFDVVFFGSGISIWEPSSLPSGEQFSAALFQLLHGALGSLEPREARLLSEIFQNLPFEVINEGSPNKSTLRGLLSSLYSKKDPNNLHRLLAREFVAGHIASLITPNYDLSVEEAIAEIERVQGKAIQYTRVVEISDVITDTTRPQYFKLHGSADLPSSLVFSLNQEAHLPDWKVTRLTELVRGKRVLILGYSGKDFDICPEIQAAKPSELYWNFRTVDDLSESVVRLAESIDCRFVVGDMREVISNIYGMLELQPSQSQVDPGAMIRTSFNEWETWFWAIRTLNSMNYSSLVIKEIEAYLSGVSQYSEVDAEILGQYGSALASSGKYVQAAKAHDVASEALMQVGLIQACASHLLGSSDALRCAGRYLAAVRRHRRAVKLTEEDGGLLPHLLRNEILLLQHAYKLSTTLRVIPIAQRIQSRAKELITLAIKHFREQGNWYPLQQMSLWNAKFDLPAENTAYKRGIQVPQAYVGYRQLNFLMGTMMAFRHDVARGSLKMSEATLQQTRSFIRTAKILGLNTEVWKLVYMIFRKATSKLKWEEVVEFLKAFFKCEYTFLYRLIQLTVEN